MSSPACRWSSSCNRPRGSLRHARPRITRESTGQAHAANLAQGRERLCAGARRLGLLQRHGSRRHRAGHGGFKRQPDNAVSVARVAQRVVRRRIGRCRAAGRPRAATLGPAAGGAGHRGWRGLGAAATRPPCRSRRSRPRRPPAHRAGPDPQAQYKISTDASKR